MRTTAEAPPSPLTAPRETVAGRRSRMVPGAAPAASAPLSEPVAIAVTTVKLLRVDEGLYALRVGEIAGRPDQVGGMTVPAVHLSTPFAEDGNGVEIVASYPRSGPWLGQEGGTVILRSPAG